jgi:anti-sigma regulatory factor (Ser/Thr protein kinase)
MSCSSSFASHDFAHAELRLPPDVSAPALARHTVQDLLSSLPDPVLTRLSLVASELVTNVLRHCSATDPDATMTLVLAADRITLTVADAGAGFDPRHPPRSDDPAGGWGLRVLDAMADRWWVELDGRTRVICEIDR